MSLDCGRKSCPRSPNPPARRWGFWAGCRDACRDRRRPSDQVFHAVLEEMVGAFDHGVFDHDALLGLELLDDAGDFLDRRDPVLVAMDEQAGRRAGREKGEVEAVGGRGDRDEALDFRPAHQQLHPDPRAEGNPGDPARAGLGADRLRPVERGRRVRQFALAVVERALRAADAAEIEAKHGESALGEGVIQVIDDLVVHRPAELRMRMKNDRDRRAALFRRMEASFETTGGSVENHLGHGFALELNDERPSYPSAGF